MSTMTVQAVAIQNAISGGAPMSSRTASRVPERCGSDPGLDDHFAGLPRVGRTDKYLLDHSIAAGTQSTRPLARGSGPASRLEEDACGKRRLKERAIDKSRRSRPWVGGHVAAKLSRTHSATAAAIFARAAAGAKSWSPPSMTTRRCVTRAWERTAA